MSAPPTDGTDAGWAERAAAGDDAAFAVLVGRNKQALHRLVARIIDDEDEAVDVVQDVFVAAHGALSRYDPARPLRAWLARIAINKARDWRRRRFVRRLVSAVLPDDTIGIVDDRPAVDAVVAGRAELARVSAAMSRLPANLREVLVLRTVEGFSQAETAQALGIGDKAVETRLYRARRRLRAELGDDDHRR